MSNRLNLHLLCISLSNYFFADFLAELFGSKYRRHATKKANKKNSPRGKYRRYIHIL